MCWPASFFHCSYCYSVYSLSSSAGRAVHTNTSSCLTTPHASQMCPPRQSLHFSKPLAALLKVCTNIIHECTYDCPPGRGSLYVHSKPMGNCLAAGRVQQSVGICKAGLQSRKGGPGRHSAQGSSEPAPVYLPGGGQHPVGVSHPGAPPWGAAAGCICHPDCSPPGAVQPAGHH